MGAGATGVDRPGDRRPAARCEWPPGASRARPHYRNLRAYRAECSRPVEALCRQQPRVHELSPVGGPDRVRAAAVRAVWRFPAIQRSRWSRDQHRGSTQLMHDAQHERPPVASPLPGNAGDGRLHQISQHGCGARKENGRAWCGLNAGVEARRRSKARRQGLCARFAARHNIDGSGERRSIPSSDLGYVFPPLWGPDSFNNGAGMARLITIANFVHANMPAGTDYFNPSLSVDYALDAAAYVVSQPRPTLAGLDKDFPDRLQKAGRCGLRPLRRWVQRAAAQIRSVRSDPRGDQAAYAEADGRLAAVHRPDRGALARLHTRRVRRREIYFPSIISTSWMRLPQVSSRTAMRAGPASMGSRVNVRRDRAIARTPFAGRPPGRRPRGCRPSRARTCRAPRPDARPAPAAARCRPVAPATRPSASVLAQGISCLTMKPSFSV